MAKDDRSSSTAIYSCSDTFESGMIESIGLLTQQTEVKFVLIVGDEVIP